MAKLSSKVDTKKITWKSVLYSVIILIVGLTAGGAIGVNITPDGEIQVETEYVDSGFSIELADEPVPTVVETEEGEVEVLDAPTVEEIDGGEIKECPEGEDCGRGAYVYVDVTSPETIKASVLGNCVNVDGIYGSQCTDLSMAVSENMTGRRLTTCGTGAAKGMVDCWEENAGEDFVMVWDANAIQPGDILVFKGGQYGHTGIAMGYANNGYVALLGTNQGGAACDGGGSAANIINMNLKNFLGAYRWKNYIPPEPEPEPEPEPVANACSKRVVVKGETMGDIMKECLGEIDWSAMDEYASKWVSVVYYPGRTVYEGWNTGTGYGLLAGDTIEFRD